MPKLTMTVKNVSGSSSPFVLQGFLKKDSGIVAPDGAVLVELDAELHEVIRIQAESIAANETFLYESDIEAIDLTDAQWAVPPSLRGRFMVLTMHWGDHNLLAQPGIL